ncbi:hypothetical protein KM043_008322 [Ampulex compressa]|nr:hypothetical protein KM043_008322 [Ampulex compressa]
MNLPGEMTSGARIYDSRRVSYLRVECAVAVSGCIGVYLTSGSGPSGAPGRNELAAERQGVEGDANERRAAEITMTHCACNELVKLSGGTVSTELSSPPRRH